MVDRILREALDRGASDIHIEPEATAVRVRFRVQGTLLEYKEVISPSYAAPLIARLKILAELDITEHRRPQDGRIAAQIGKQELNLRIATIAVARGEKGPGVLPVRVGSPILSLLPLPSLLLRFYW